MRIGEAARDLRAGARDLASALFGAGPETLCVAGRLRLHRGLVAAGSGLAVALGVACAASALLPEPDPDLVWFVYEHNDRRWLVLCYGLGVAALWCAPLFALRRRAFWSASDSGAEASARSAALRVCAALGAYALWLGPPWNVELLARPMEWHELVHLGPLQALLAGKDFYLESGTQYGPGLQLLSIHYLERFGVSLASFREFWLWTNFAGGAVLVAWLARLFPLLPLLAGLFALRCFSPFGFYAAAEGGSYGFFYGWATLVRYAGGIHAVLALGSVLARTPPGGAQLAPGERLFLLLSGIAWGWFALLAQENLGSGVLGSGMLVAFALLTRAATPGRLAAMLLAFAAGALLGVSPLLLLFAAAGQLGAFAARYFEVGSYVFQGFSSTPFDGSWLSPVGMLYLGAPLAALALFGVAAFDGRRARPWRMAAAASAAAALAGHVPALLRSDQSHLLAMLAPVAFLLAAALAGLLRGGLRPASAPLLLVALLPTLLALRPQHGERLLADLRGRVAAFAARGASDGPVGGRVGFRYDLAAPYSVFSELPLGEFLALSRRLHEKVGARPVVVASAVGGSGHWYFFADLVPLMPDPEPMMTIHNNRLRARYLAELAARGIPCVISTRPRDAELALFRRQPGAREEWTLETSAGAFLVGCRRDAGTQREGLPGA